MNDKLRQFSKELNDELKNILQYWMENSLDDEYGGFHGKINHFNKVIHGATKGAVLNARILWTFSAAFRYSGDPAHLEIATRAYEYLKSHFYDSRNSGLIWEVDVHGNPKNTRKQIYAQGFGIYGFSEYFRATNDQESLRLARALYAVIEEHSYDTTHGGYLEALSQDWKPLNDMRLSEKDENYPKSMNTHLHILEPYTNLCRVWKDESLKQKIKSLIQVFLDRIIDKGTNHFHLFFDRNWDVKSRIVSYGHDIEGTWLLTEAAEAIDDQGLLKEVKNAALTMTDATINEGIDGDHGLFYEKNMLSGHIDTDRHWWPQAEAMIGFVNAYQISGDKKYLDLSMKIWNFIKENIIDSVHGEWYWRVDKDGKPVTQDDKAGFWKCPYHNSRACLELIGRIDKLLL